MFLSGHDMATSSMNIPVTCWIVITLSIIKHSTCQNVSGKGEVEEKAQYLDPYSRSQINVTVAVWDDSRKKEMEEMTKWNKEFATSIGSLRLLECNMPLIHLFKNMTSFSQMFENCLSEEKIELERLRREIEGLESEKSLFKETVAVEIMNVKECMAKYEKISEELTLVDKDRHMIKIQYTKLEKELESEKRKALRLQKDMEYKKKEIENNEDKLRKFLSMESGLDIFVTWRTSINAVILDVRNKYEEQLRKLQAMYEKRKASEIYAIQVKIKETLKEDENSYKKEINSLQERVSLLDRQLEDKERYKQAIEMEYRSYRESSHKRIRELESELSSVTVVIGRFSTDEISLQSELDTYGILQEELKQIMSNINSCSETMNIIERTSDTTIRDTSIVAEKTDPLQSTDATRSEKNAFWDDYEVDPKIHPVELKETPDAGKVDDSITTAQHDVEQTSEKETNE